MVSTRLHIFSELNSHSNVYACGWFLGSGLFWMGQKIHLHILKNFHCCIILCCFSPDRFWDNIGKSWAVRIADNVNRTGYRVYSE